jgi:ABC-type transporter Mla subunit MlaD
VRVQAANAAGIGAGTRVTLNGVQIGNVKSVATVPNVAPPATNPSELRLPSSYALLVLEISEGYNIPIGTVAQVGGPSIGIGNVSVALSPPATADKGFLPKDGTASILGGPAPSGLLPPEVFADVHAVKEDLSKVASATARASDNISDVARDLHVLLSMRTIGPDGKPVPEVEGKPAENIFTLVLKLNSTIDHVNNILADPKLPGHISAIAANLADSSAKIKEVITDINTNFTSVSKKIGSAADQFSATIKGAEPAIDNISKAAKTANDTLEVAQARIIVISEDLSKSLKNLDASVNAITSGDGTTGKLVKDSKLYDGLVDLTNNLKATTDELNRLIHQWRQDGIPLKLGGGK